MPTTRGRSTTPSAASTATTRATAGALAIMELFKLDAEIDELIARRATGREIRAAATAKGFRTLADDAHRARAPRADEPGGDLARGRPHRPRDLKARAWRSSPIVPSMPKGASRSGSLDAINAIDLELRLKRLGLDLVTFEGVKSSTAARTRSVTRPELITFCFHLSQLLKAGVNIIEALTDLRDTVDNPGFRQVIASLLEDIEGGLKLSEAMANHSLLLRRRVRRAGARRRAERHADRGARRALREPQVAGRDGQPGQEGADLPDARAGGDHRRGVRADDRPRAAARGHLQDAGAEAAARDRGADLPVRTSS